jgi:hypothetical protein
VTATVGAISFLTTPAATVQVSNSGAMLVYIYRMLLLLGAAGMTEVEVVPGRVRDPCTSGEYGKYLIHGRLVTLYCGWNECHLLYQEIVAHSSCE